MSREKTADLRIGPWQVFMEWSEDADQGGPVYLSIEPGDDADPWEIAGGLSSTVLRQINFQEAIDQWRRESPGTVLDEYFRERLRELVSEGVTDQYLAYLASVYVGMVRAGEKGITAKLADATGKKLDTVKAHLKAARKREFLTVIPGKAGGQLTEKAAALLGKS